MGTSAFAVPALTQLIRYHKIQAVFTQNAKASGRGLKIQSSAVCQLANLHNIAVYTPSTLRSPEILELIQSLDAELIVVCAYGFIIPKAILDAKRYGCLNIHPSLLPKYRGAAPLQRAIINNDTKTAVCIMQMDQGLDTGPIILQQEVELSGDTILQQLHDQCAEIGSQLLLRVIEQIDVLPRIAQSKDGISYAHKLMKQEARINWHNTAEQINGQIRGMNPWPGSFFLFNDLEIKVRKASAIDQDHDAKPGTILDNTMKIACGKGVLQIHELQKSGGRIMNIGDFLRGFNFTIGNHLIS